MEVRLLVSIVLFVAVSNALAQVQTITPVVNNVQNAVDIHDVPVIKEKPKPVIRYKLIRMSDEDIKKEEEAKKQQALHDAQHKMWHKKLFPCRDYSPICSRYKNIWNPGVAQCRDVFMQTNCRETCGLCNVPIGVYLGCNDMHHCKALGSNACVHKWVEETCKTMCGSCDGSKGRKNARVGASSVFVGKKKSIVSSKDAKKVKTVYEAVENQHKPLETTENKVANEEAHDQKDDNKDDDDDMEDQASAAKSAENMENEGSAEQPQDDTKSEVEKPKAEEKVVKAPEPQKDTPKKVAATKKPVHPKKIHHHHKHHHHHHKHHHAKKATHDKKHAKIPIKAIIKKHKKNTKS